MDHGWGTGASCEVDAGQAAIVKSCSGAERNASVTLRAAITQAAFGWRTNTQSAVYTRTAEDRRLAIQAARKRAGNKTAHTFAPEPPTPDKKGTKSDG